MSFMACGTEIVVERFDIAEFRPRLPRIGGCLVAFPAYEEFEGT
jgi:hypothetical protein